MEKVAATLDPQILANVNSIERLLAGSEPSMPPVEDVVDSPVFAARVEAPAESPADYSKTIDSPTLFEQIQSRFNDFKEHLPRPSKLSRRVFVLGVATLAACGGGVVRSQSSGPKAHYATPVAAGLPETNNCPTSWEIHPVTHEGNRVIGAGIQEIGLAKTPAQARAAMDKYMQVVEGDPHVFVGVDAGILNRTVSASELVNPDGKCASPKAVEEASAMEAYLGRSSITPGQAPTTGVNTGADANGNVVAAFEPGIGGDRTALDVVGPDGKEVFVMKRCGNLVFKAFFPISLPKGPTEEHLVPPPPPTTPPGPKPASDFNIVNTSPTRQDIPNHSGVYVGPTRGPDGQPIAEPPTNEQRGPGTPAGNSDGTPGNGGVGTGNGNTDNTHSGDTTNNGNQPATDPFGNPIK